MDIAECAVGIECQRAICHSRHQHCRQRIRFRIAVIGEDAGRAARQRGGRATFAHSERIRHRHRRIVHRRDGNGHCDNVRVGRAIVGAIGEAVAGRLAAIVDISECAVGIECQRSLRHISHHHRRERCAFGVRVVQCHAISRRHCQRAAFVHTVGIRHRHRCIICWRDDDGHCDNVRVGRAIVGAIGEAVAGRLAAIVDISECAVGIECQRSIRHISHHHRRERRAFRVCVVQRHAISRRHCQRAAFAHAVGIIRRYRCIVHARDGNRHRDRVRVGRAIVGAIGEAVARGLAAIVDIAERAVSIQRQRAIDRACHQDSGERIGFGITVIGEDARCPAR